MPSDKIRQLEIELNEVLVMTLNELIEVNEKLRAGEITYAEWLDLAFPVVLEMPEDENDPLYVRDDMPEIFDEETDPALADYRQLKERFENYG